MNDISCWNSAGSEINAEISNTFVDKDENIICASFANYGDKSFL